jgi:hypothetical protein
MTTYFATLRKILLKDTFMVLGTPQEIVESYNLCFPPHPLSCSFRQFGVGLLNDISSFFVRRAPAAHGAHHANSHTASCSDYIACCSLLRGVRAVREMNVMRDIRPCICRRKCIDIFAQEEGTPRIPMSFAATLASF